MSANSSAQQQTQESASTDNNPKPCVLIIDDSRMIRISLTRILKNEFNIIEAADGEQGWQALNENESVQVVITDADMPVLNGYDLITRIRQSDEPRYQDIPIIMITGAEEDHIREKALNTGATDFIVKPPDKTQLLARVRANAKAASTTRKLSEEATTDALTKVSSKKFFMQRGEQDLAFANRHGKDMAVAAIALDNFQALLKQHGTKAAKVALVKAADILKSSVRTEDTVARIGDFAFAIIAPNASALESATLCVRLKDSLASADYGELSLTASIGLSCLSQDHPDSIKTFLDTSLARATEAIKAGGNQLVAWQAEVAPAPDEEPPAAEAVAEPVVEPETEVEEFETPVVESVEVQTETVEAVEMTVEATDAAEAAPAMEAQTVAESPAIREEDRQYVMPNLRELVINMMPLLEQANKALGWNIDEHIKAIRDKLSNK